MLNVQVQRRLGGGERNCATSARPEGASERARAGPIPAALERTAPNRRHAPRFCSFIGFRVHFAGLQAGCCQIQDPACEARQRLGSTRQRRQARRVGFSTV